MNFNEIFWRIVTYDDIKGDLKTNLYTLFRQYQFSNLLILTVIVWIFLNETSILVFAKLTIFHFI